MPLLHEAKMLKRKNRFLGLLFIGLLHMMLAFCSASSAHAAVDIAATVTGVSPSGGTVAGPDINYGTNASFAIVRHTASDPATYGKYVKGRISGYSYAYSATSWITLNVGYGDTSNMSAGWQKLNVPDGLYFTTGQAGVTYNNTSYIYDTVDSDWWEVY